MRKRVVIDTNVLVTAEGGPGASRSCAASCQNKLLEIQAAGSVALDTGWLIIREYEQNLQTSRQPGVGFRFLQWLLNTRSAKDHCSWITITPQSLRGFEEFPDHPGLKKFDRSDRKFVAVAARHSPKLPIVQATDSKWVGWAAALAECAIEVEFVCKNEIKLKYEQKIGYGR
jgi:hypothetical protein